VTTHLVSANASRFCAQADTGMFAKLVTRDGVCGSHIVVIPYPIYGVHVTQHEEKHFTQEADRLIAP
jgi:hypothetical protein